MYGWVNDQQDWCTPSTIREVLRSTPTTLRSCRRTGPRVLILPLPTSGPEFGFGLRKVRGCNGEGKERWLKMVTYIRDPRRHNPDLLPSLSQYSTFIDSQGSTLRNLTFLNGPHQNSCLLRHSFLQYCLESGSNLPLVVVKEERFALIPNVLESLYSVKEFFQKGLTSLSQYRNSIPGDHRTRKDYQNYLNLMINLTNKTELQTEEVKGPSQCRRPCINN